MNSTILSKSEKNNKLKEQVMKAKNKLAALRENRTSRQVVPFMDHLQKTSRSGAGQVLQSEGDRKKYYSEALKGDCEKLYKITLKSKDNNQTAEQIRSYLKNINPTEIK